MFNRLNDIVYKVRALGSEKWGDKEVVDKILCAYMARDVNLPTLIREKTGFKRFTPANIVGRMEEHLITVKEARIAQEISKIHEQLEKKDGVLEKKDGVALKASKKSESKGKQVAKASCDDEYESDEDMALFMKRFKKAMKKGGYFNDDKKKSKTKRKSDKPCFECGGFGHFVAGCPNPIKKNNNGEKSKKNSGEAHLGQE
ncbi:hypothetical protein BAE44_0010601 [Dichanthelium oligosanthes]|uniref:CCHC-type domain-containing protein n=1 Tax=Dichanthelium oligosanthes TaxID=888268 RepID=A0A1E5VTE8_9POAL|nr:hypothetical protein BAE44_0010601 [Dichanthelium oligosanthes]